MLKRCSVTAALVAMVLSCPVALAVPALAEPAVPAKSHAGPVLRTGDLVHLRSGGPLMTVARVQGDEVTCDWSTENGEVRSNTYRIAELSAPITLPPVDPNLRKGEAAADRYYRKHCPSGAVSFATGKFECAL